MTSYHGGKQRIGEQISQIISNIATDLEKKNGKKFKGYCEPFCGMCGVYEYIPKHFDNKLKFKAGDLNKSVIEMWSSLQDGWNPPTQCSEQRFEKLKGTSFSAPEKGFIGHACAFRGIYFSKFKYSNAIKHSAKRVKKMANILKNVNFKHGSYKQFSNLKNFIIYCDPPYYDTNCRYYNEDLIQQHFDHIEFYNWVEKMSKHNLVFISEYKNLPYKQIANFGKELLFLV